MFHLRYPDTIILDKQLQQNIKCLLILLPRARIIIQQQHTCFIISHKNNNKLEM